MTTVAPETIAASRLHAFAVAVLERVGMDTPDAIATADAMVWADLRDLPMHGVYGKLPQCVRRIQAGVTSPTFALVHRYASPKSAVYHLDLYRLETPADLTNLGWDEIVSDHALVLIEWPEHAGDRIPTAHVPISLQHLPDDPARRLLYAGGHT